MEKRQTRKQRRLAERAVMKETNQVKFPTIGQLHFELNQIQPKTENQALTFDAYKRGNNLFLHGCAGTGKSFITMYLALKEIEDKRSTKRKIVIIRSAQPSKQIGFLPGSEKQKLEVYEAPYRAICSELYHRDDAYEVMKKKGLVEFHGTSFLRGTTIDDAVILVDEVQNLSYGELRTVITRTGNNSRIIFCGDTKQDDLTSERFKETSGLIEISKIFNRMEGIETIQFEIEDVVRSGFVKQFLIAEYQMGT